MVADEGRRGGTVCVANGELAPATRGGYPALFSKKLKAVTKHIDRTFFWMSLADPPATASHRRATAHFTPSHHFAMQTHYEHVSNVSGMRCLTFL